jgi:hypothetical protein
VATISVQSSAYSFVALLVVNMGCSDLFSFWSSRHIGDNAQLNEIGDCPFNDE